MRAAHRWCAMTPVDPRRNIFGALRLALAVTVVVAHSFPLGYGHSSPWYSASHGQTDLGSLAVLGFFAISGYLVTLSAARTHPARFAWHRILRIFPAFWVALVVTAFVFAPLALHHRSGAGGLSELHPGPTSYVTSNWWTQMRQYGVGDLLVETPYGALTGRSVFDGSLWSLRFELACYLALFVLAVLGTRRCLRLSVGVAAGLVAVASVLQWLPRDRYGTGPSPLPTPVLPLLGALDPSTAAPMTLAFAVGALVAVFPTQLAMGRWPALVALGIFAGTLEFGAFDVVGVPAFAYVILFLGSRAPAALRNVGTRTDISYGVYIYGFPIEQLLALNGVPAHGHLLYLGTSIALALVAGWISWQVVESRALRLKGWRPGRSPRTSPAGHPSVAVATAPGQQRCPATDPAGMM